MRITDAFREFPTLPAGEFHFEWDHQHCEERKIREREALDESQAAFKKGTPKPSKQRCFGCLAEIEVKPRLKPDWRLGPTQHFNAGTNAPHDCIELRRNIWKHRVKRQ